LQLSPPREIRRKDLESISTTPRFLRCVPTMACASLLAFVLLALATVAGSSNGGGIGEGFRSAGLPRGFEEVNFEHFRKSLATLWQRLTSRDPAELAAKLAIELGSQQLARCTRPCNASGPPLLLLLLARCALPSEPAADATRSLAAFARARSRWRTWRDDTCLPPSLRPMVRKIETGMLSRFLRARCCAHSWALVSLRLTCARTAASALIQLAYDPSRGGNIMGVGPLQGLARLRGSVLSAAPARCA
jgi:hypothetical protein